MVKSTRGVAKALLLVVVMWIFFGCIASDDDNDDKKDRKLLAPFDTDILSEDECRSLLAFCQSDIYSHVYLQCPMMCTTYLQAEGGDMKGTADAESRDALWEVGTLRTFSGRRVDADRFEGYVTVISLLPLLPGMAFYYYEMMEHLHTVFSPTVEFVVIPIDVGEGIHIKPHAQPNVVVLEEESAIHTHPWVQHLHSIQPRSGTAETDHTGGTRQMELPTDRLTVYIVSADGYFVERLTVPTLATLQRTISTYLKTHDYNDL